MAWLDDRLWCHPKVLPLSDTAKWVYVAGVCYSSGMRTRGVLDSPTQRLIGAENGVRAELIKAGLWDATKNGAVLIHDWEEHNGIRDERRAREAARLREYRRKQKENQ